MGRESRAFDGVECYRHQGEDDEGDEACWQFGGVGVRGIDEGVGGFVGEAGWGWHRLGGWRQ